MGLNFIVVGNSCVFAFAVLVLMKHDARILCGMVEHCKQSDLIIFLLPQFIHALATNASWKLLVSIDASEFKRRNNFCFSSVLSLFINETCCHWSGHWTNNYFTTLNFILHLGLLNGSLVSTSICSPRRDGNSPLQQLVSSPSFDRKVSYETVLTVLN